MLAAAMAVACMAYPGPGCGSDPDVSAIDEHNPPLLPPWPATYNMSLSTVFMPW